HAGLLVETRGRRRRDLTESRRARPSAAAQTPRLSLRIHDWDDYVGKLIDRRTRDRERKRREREESRSGESQDMSLAPSDGHRTDPAVRAKPLPSDNPKEVGAEPRQLSTGRPTRTQHDTTGHDQGYVPLASQAGAKGADSVGRQVGPERSDATTTDPE